MVQFHSSCDGNWHVNRNKWRLCSLKGFSAYENFCRKVKLTSFLHIINAKFVELYFVSSSYSRFTFATDLLTSECVCPRCSIDLSQLEREKTHRLWQDLEEGGGSIFLLLTISGTTASETISDLSMYEDNPRERINVENRYVRSTSSRYLQITDADG